MKAYELLFFVAPSIDEETRAAVMKRIDTTIAEGKGTGTWAPPSVRHEKR